MTVLDLPDEGCIYCGADLLPDDRCSVPTCEGHWYGLPKGRDHRGWVRS